MKRFLLIIGLLIAGIGATFAQQDTISKRDKMFREVQEFKMKFLAQEMQLNESQKKQFYELYEEMSQSKKECYAEAVKMDHQLKHEKDASEESYQQVTAAFAKANSEWAEKEKQFNEKFAEFLTQKQIYKMREAENSFKARIDQMKRTRNRDHHKKPIERK
ncbi:MAG: hypothetical protein J1D77_01405 [Muribaculaceae bacterium]|nr:hypothetical protein [Muribaculaceae bacterium]